MRATLYRRNVNLTLVFAPDLKVTSKMLHRRIILPAISRLDEKRGSFFMRVVDGIEQDKRADAWPNLPFLVLRETLDALPTYLEPSEMTDVLFDYLDIHAHTINQFLHSAEYITTPYKLTVLCSEFVQMVIRKTLETADLETRDNNGLSRHHLSWPVAIVPEQFPNEED